MPLVTDSEGKKFGKTEKGAVYLDPELTSPYDFYQFWLNTPDADVARFLRWLTFLPRPEIETLEGQVGTGERVAQKALAADLTARVHGPEALETVLGATSALFSKCGGAGATAALAAAPGITVPASRFAGEGALLVDLLAESGACASKSD